jgi:hypothetical protein
VLDYLNVAAAEARQTSDETKTIDGATYRLTRWSDTRHFFKRIEIADGSDTRPLTFVEQVVKFGVNDFQRMFARAGLTIQKVYGDYRLTRFDADTSPRLVLVARKGCAAPMRLQDLAEAA